MKHNKGIQNASLTSKSQSLLWSEDLNQMEKQTYINVNIYLNCLG